MTLLFLQPVNKDTMDYKEQGLPSLLNNLGEFLRGLIDGGDVQLSA